MSENPYITGPPVTGNNFFGREDLLSTVRDTLTAIQRKAVVLYGQSRVGKTSILLELSHFLPADTFHIVYLDWKEQTARNRPQMQHQLAVTIAASLGMDPPRPGRFRDERYLPNEFLPTAGKALEERRLLLLFDSFDALDETIEGTEQSSLEVLLLCLGQLAAVDNPPAFVFAVGQRMDRLVAHFQMALGEPAYVRVPPFSRAEAERLITAPAAGTLEYTTQAADAIFDLSGGHPFFIQLICRQVFDRQQRAGRQQVTAGDVEAVVGEALEAGDAALAELWDSLSPAEQVILSLVAEEKGEGEGGRRLPDVFSAHRLQLQGVELLNAPNQLIAGEILTQDAPGEYHFVIELVRRWVAHKHPFSRERATVDRVNARAARDYERASKAHETGNLELAIELYGLALVANANHFGAQVGLARALYEQGAFQSAVAEYEKAFWMNEAAVRDELLAARVAWGKALEKEGDFEQAVEQFRTVLEMSPGEPRVQDHLSALYRQGKQYAASRKWEAAIRALEQVLAIDPQYKDAAERLDEVRQEMAARPLRQRLLIGGAVAGLLVLCVAGALAARGVWTLVNRPPTPTAAASVSYPTRPLAETATFESPVATPTNTAIPTPTQPPPTDTPTPEPTPVPTDTPPPTDTPLPTEAPPTDTPTPEPTDTPVALPPPPAPTDTPEPTPTPVFIFPAPIPTWPEDGQGFKGRDQFILLAWRLESRPLEGEERFEVTLSYTAGGEKQERRELVQRASWAVPPGYAGGADANGFQWNVRVVLVAADGTRQPLSPVSETRTFYWEE